MPSETINKTRKDTKNLQQKILRKILSSELIGQITDVEQWFGPRIIPTPPGWRNPYHKSKVLFVFGFIKGIYTRSKQFQYPKVSLSMLDELSLYKY